MTKKCLNITDLLNIHHCTDEKVEVQRRRPLVFWLSLVDLLLLIQFMYSASFSYGSSRVEPISLLFPFSSLPHFLACNHLPPFSKAAMIEPFSHQITLTQTFLTPPFTYKLACNYFGLTRITSSSWPQLTKSLSSIYKLNSSLWNNSIFTDAGDYEMDIFGSLLFCLNTTAKDMWKNLSLHTVDLFPEGHWLPGQCPCASTRGS